MFITPTNPIILDPSGPASIGHVDPVVGAVMAAIFGVAIIGLLIPLAWMMWKCR